MTETLPLGHEFKQWVEKPDYLWCMEQVPDGPGYLRICRRARTRRPQRVIAAAILHHWGLKE